MGQHPKPVELRIHGTGGSSPDQLLDVVSEHHTVKVAGGAISSFHARRSNREIEGYIWGFLTTESTFQFLWPFLLPFTLLNVGGWMHRAPPHHILARSIRRLIILLGYTLTFSWVLWITVIIADQIAWQWGAQWGVKFTWLSGQWGDFARLGVGAALALFTLAAIVVAARHSSRDYEGFDPPTEWLRPFDDQARDALEDPGFWRGRQEASKRCNWHIVTGGLFFVLLVAYSFVSLASVDTSRHQVAPFIVERPLGLGDVFVLLVSAQFLLLTLLSIASIVETVLSGVKRVWKKDWRIVEIGHGWRFIGPFAAATTSLGLTHGAFSGLAKWSGDRLGDCMPHSVVVEAHAKMTGRTARAVRDEIDETVCGSDALSRIQFDVGLGEHLLDDVLGFATLLAVIAIALLGVWHFVNLGTRHVQVPVDSGSSPGGELKGLPNEAWRKKVARFRSIAKIFRRSGVTLLLPSLGFILYGFWKGAWRTYPWWTHLFDQDRLHVSRLQLWEYPLRFEACSSGLQGFGEWLTTACGGFKVEPTWLASFGGWVVGLTVVLVPGLLWAAVRQRSLRKLIGNVWDVLTFWPRWLHPFCVRPYAERAVPELQWRMSELAKHYQPIVISAHSQGSVLAVAALWSLREGLTKRVCLVTYGSPIATLHARFFPAYFGRGQPSNLELLNGRLCHWHNFYRLTDYIGQSLEEADDHDPLPDPPEQPLAEEVGTDPLIFLDEAPLTPWTRFNLHSNYRKETEVKDALKACKNLACSSDLWENDRRHTSQGPSDAEE